MRPKTETTQRVRISFPRTQFDSRDLARTLRYVDYVFADSLQVLTLVAGYGRVPDRQGIPRPEILRVNMSSPLWFEIASGSGVGGAVVWFFRYAIRNPGEIGAWWNNVKIGRERSRQELEALSDRNSIAALTGGASDAADAALQLAGEAAPQLPELLRDAPSESLPVARRPRPGPTSNDRDVLRYEPGLIAAEPTESTPERVIARWRSDAERLRRVAGVPEVQDVRS